MRKQSELRLRVVLAAVAIALFCGTEVAGKEVAIEICESDMTQHDGPAYQASIPRPDLEARQIVSAHLEVTVVAEAEYNCGDVPLCVELRNELDEVLVAGKEWFHPMGENLMAQISLPIEADSPVFNESGGLIIDVWIDVEMGCENLMLGAAQNLNCDVLRVFYVK
jgi:hypothetical protein